jgi:competence protein ComEC
MIVILLLRVTSSGYEYHQGDRVQITSRIKTEPVRYDNSQRIDVAGLKTYLSLYPEISYGDYVVIEGVVEDKKLVSPILLKLEKPDNKLVGFREKLLSFYQSSVPEPDSSLLSGIILGSKKSIPKEFWNNLKYTGTLHVVVASGMNVSIVARFLIGVLIVYFKRIHAIPVSIVGIWVYSYLSGFDAPIIRAAIMATFAFTAQGLGRISSSWKALFYSAAVMLFIYPEWIYDIGFVLSFVATLSLLMFERKIREAIKFVPFIFREGFSTSVAAQIGVFPVLYYYFGRTNLLSPLINALVLWTIPLITVIGMFSGLVGMLFPRLGEYIVLLAYPLTTWFVLIVEMFSRL